MSVLPAPRTGTPDEEVVGEPVAPLIDIGMPPALDVIAEREALLRPRPTVPQASRSAMDATRPLAPAPRPILVASPLDLRRPRHYPPPSRFLDSSRMDRELHRL